MNWRFLQSKHASLTKEKWLEAEPALRKEINDYNSRIHKHFMDEKEKFILSHTRVKTYDMELQRAVIMNPLTDKKDIDNFIAVYKNFLNTL